MSCIGRSEGGGSSAGCRRGTRLVVCAALLGAACSVGSVGDSSGPSVPGDTTGGNPGTIQRATLTVRLTIDPGDSQLAAQAGVGVAGIQVRLERQASSSPPTTATTDASGVARFESLLQGTYIVSSDRPLSAAERAALPASDADVTVFAGARRVSVTPPAPSTSIDLVASRRGSLVLSEVQFSPRANTTGTLGSAQYIEFFNAADTAIHLDGLLYFQTALNLHRVVREQYQCDMHNAVERIDADAIWATFIWRFPGSGQTYRVNPGEAVVLAVDATDHRLIHPSLPDLRAAHFEFIGDPSDPDNPGAANMIPLRGIPSAGNNLTGNQLIGVAHAIARDTSELVRRNIVNTSSTTGELVGAFRLPRGAILDVGAFSTTLELNLLLSGMTCEPFTNPVFDRAPAPLVDNDVDFISRKGLGFTETGIEILQRTRTSERDFALGEALRRSLRKQ